MMINNTLLNRNRCDIKPPILVRVCPFGRLAQPFMIIKLLVRKVKIVTAAYFYQLIHDKQLLTIMLFSSIVLHLTQDRQHS